MKAVVRAIRRWTVGHLPDFLHLPMVNAKKALQGRKFRIRVFGDDLYQVDDGEETIIISQKGRRFRYKRGVSFGIDRLARQYNLHQLPVTPGGVFIDCGANVGELGFWARRHGLIYHAFEPELKDARCCDLNNFDGRRQRVQARFYVVLHRERGRSIRLYCFHMAFQRLDFT